MSIGHKGVEITKSTEDNIIEAKITGKLTEKDYEIIIPELERHFKEDNKPRLLIELHDFEGWTAGALWEDIKFDFKHFHDIEKIAIVGESKWEQTATLFSKPFTGANLRYFAGEDLDEARKWIRE